MSAIMLRRCEVVLYDAVNRDPVRCDQPGSWWAAPNNKTYIACESHGFLAAIEEAAMTAPTPAEAKKAAKDAVAMLQASAGGVDVGSVAPFVANPPLVLAEMARLVGGLLEGLDSDGGLGRRWLDEVGLLVEEMPA